jgi:hypothetical protein
MKSILILMFLILVSPFAQSHELECKIEEQYSGVWNVECPRGAVMTGARARISGNFIWTDVECVRQKIVCTEKNKKDVDENSESDYNSKIEVTQ